MTTPNPASTFFNYGLTVSRNDGRGDPNPGLHHHNEFELVFMTRGEAFHEHGGRVFSFPVRRLTVIWGGIPHRTFKRRYGSETWAVIIPISVFFNWGLPRETFLHPLLRGKIFYEADPESAALDAAAIRRWFDDINAAADPAAAAALRLAMLCEVQGRLLRLALGNNTVRMAGPSAENPAGVVNRMLRHIAENYQDSALDVAAIARHARLHPSYASELFRRTCGVSLMRYVTRQRITHAQCLLSGGGAKILDIALNSGFGSESRFYQVFRAAIGVTPREYAKARGNTPRG